MRFGFAMTTLSLALPTVSGCSKKPEKLGLAYAGSTTAEHVRLLVDETWVDASGQRHVDQEIFASVFEMIDEAERFILIDFFLVNRFLYEPGPGMRELSRELSDKLMAKRNAHPEVEITFISDPVNTMYGSLEAPLFSAMQQAGVRVVWTDLNQLRDSNAMVSKPWRILGKPWGTGPGKAMKSPLGDERISMRSFLKMLNFKANHRKVVVTEKSLLVTSANPHDGSSAHWNLALRVDGAGMSMACESESAILRMSGADTFRPALSEDIIAPQNGRYRLELLTEGRIKEKVLLLLAQADTGARIDLCMFYLSDRGVMKALIDAQKRECRIRVILDPAKDAFGRKKNGIPNRQSAIRLVKAGIPMRWADTHGEQCHVKMLYVEHADDSATLLLGSCNYTRRNMDNFNAECNLALGAVRSDANMQRAREVFDRWWSNPDGRIYTTEYGTYADPSVHRRIRAWWLEQTGMGTF